MTIDNDKNDENGGDNDGNNNARTSNGIDSHTQMNDISQITQKDIGEGIEQSLSDFSQIITEIISTEAEQESKR